MRPAPITADHLIDNPEAAKHTFRAPLVGGPPNCADVDVLYGATADGRPVIRIPWQLEDDDLDRLTRGEPVWLTIWAAGMPPVALGTLGPDERFDFA